MINLLNFKIGLKTLRKKRKITQKETERLSGNMGYKVDSFAWTKNLWGSCKGKTSKQRKKIAFSGKLYSELYSFLASV